ncbi:MAG: hypothetical protein GYA55_01470 [SAR324 cluster bacterium]|uniref:Uncharacterized protein n=1 Tax=SAR324 cluster bacterium TaxID=2024889 RepID=A0A7X9FPF9_9DELT|nr:hypothetical protein [SAR324 cluster bacterium]
MVEVDVAVLEGVAEAVFVGLELAVGVLVDVDVGDGVAVGQRKLPCSSNSAHPTSRSVSCRSCP